QNMPLVAVDAKAACLATVAHVRILDADPPVLGHALTNRGLALGVLHHVLLPNLPGDRQVGAYEGILSLRRLRCDQPLAPLPPLQRPPGPGVCDPLAAPSPVPNLFPGWLSPPPPPHPLPTPPPPAPAPADGPARSPPSEERVPAD